MWTDVAWHRGATGAPLLDGALGWLDCSLVDEHPTGDHTLFVGEVATLARGDAPAGLLYVERAYRAAPA
jgi:flavin reductase (DIM6/NTAB) family NADH-FMN oxidoreductase RutF